MLVYVIRRSLQSLVVLVAMSLLVFVGVFAIGNPVDILINPQAEQLERERAIAELGLDRPLHEQYATFIRGALAGDLGRSFVHASPALSLILERMPATL
jgi:peptide/nickel transport system permease protein